MGRVVPFHPAIVPASRPSTQSPAMPAGERPRRGHRRRRFSWDPITTAELAVQPDHEMIFARKVTPTARSRTEIERPTARAHPRTGCQRPNRTLTRDGGGQATLS